MATVDVGARAVHSGLRSLRAQALRVGTSARAHQAQQLKKMADSLPISPHSLFGEGLQPVIAKAASSARHYAEMADGFVQAGLSRPRPLHHTNLAIAIKGRGRTPPRLFVHATASPRAGATSPPPRGGTRRATAHLRPLTNPPECVSPLLDRNLSPRANNPGEGAEGERPPSPPDSIPRARAGSQIQARCPPNIPQSWSSARSPKPHGDIHCLRPEIPVAGRLSHFLPFWREVIQADRWVLEVISQGYAIELLRTPQYRGVKSTPPPRAGPGVLSDEVEDLLRKGVIKPVPLHQERSGFYSTYFLVPKRDGGHRPILNLKLFNFGVRKTSFRMETLKSMIAVMRPHQWLASVDLKDAYFHVGVTQAHRRYLRFRWLGQSYQFEALPFGLSSAPRVFTKTLAPLMAWLRLMGIHLYPYLDDILIQGESVGEVEQSVQATLQVLTRAGFIVNLKKSNLTPTQDLVYIGARFRTDLGRVYLPENRIEGLLTLTRSFAKVGRYVTALLYLSLLGLMAATLLSVEFAHLRMRPIQWYLKRRWNHVTHGLRHKILVSKDLGQALQWWLVRENLSQGIPFSLPTTTITITTDASMEGWGGHCRLPQSTTALTVASGRRQNANSTSMCWSSGRFA